VAGDNALIAMSQALARVVRAEDCAARFGGEEFSILVADCTPDTLMAVAERIRKVVSALKIPSTDGSQELSITVSIGARMIYPERGINSLMLLGDADKALYKSKTEGRNRSTLYKQGFLGRAARLKANL
jgi:diguanylate cyclase (GGDEF)-like protein